MSPGGSGCGQTECRANGWHQLCVHRDRFSFCYHINHELIVLEKCHPGRVTAHGREWLKQLPLEGGQATGQAAGNFTPRRRHRALGKEAAGGCGHQRCPRPLPVLQSWASRDLIGPDDPGGEGTAHGPEGQTAASCTFLGSSKTQCSGASTGDHHG